MATATQLEFIFRSLIENRVGTVWQYQFNRLWPAYRRWFLRYGEKERPTYYESLQALRTYMPEFLPTYEAMVEAAGGGDHAARFLSQYKPPPLFRGCSQAVYIKDEPVIVRNYDYSPYIFDGLLMKTHFDQRSVIAMTDCMSGVLDGMNEDGLAISMSFGGREEFGDGFGVTLLIRYLLEYATNVKEAVELARGIPIHGAYNLTLIDASASHATLEIAAHQKTRVTNAAIATNHQQLGNWPLYEEKVHSERRYQFLEEVVVQQQDTAESFASRFLQPPLFSTEFARGFGTLYTSAYYPCRRECHYLWPNNEWRFNFQSFNETEYHINYIDPQGFPEQSGFYAEVNTSNRVPGLAF